MLPSRTISALGKILTPGFSIAQRGNEMIFQNDRLCEKLAGVAKVAVCRAVIVVEMAKGGARDGFVS